MNLIPQALRLAKPTAGEASVKEQQLLLHNISWDAYEAIGNALQDRPALRLTYDHG